MTSHDDVQDMQSGNSPLENRPNGRPANDNGAVLSISLQGEAVREIDFGTMVADLVAQTIVKFTTRDLKGARLLHAGRQVEHAICLATSAANRDVLVEFARGQIDAVIVRRLVSISEDLEPTPNGREPSGHARRYILSNAGLSLAGGQLPAAVTNENHGKFDRHVRPLLWQMNIPSSTGGGELGPHTEHSFRDDGYGGRVSPQVDSICLVGLRNESAEPTGFATLADVLGQLEPATVSTLMQPIYDMEPPDSCDASHGAMCVPILYRRQGQLQCAYRADKVRVPDSVEARNAVRDLNVAIQKAARSVVLMPGDAWLARNPRCFHWRDNVQNPSRWLIRSFGMAPYSPALYARSNSPELLQY